MLPAVSESLEALKSRMAETIIPALPAGEVFAQEQAGLMLATLDWLIDVHSHELAYEVVENEEYRSLVDTLSRALPTESGDELLMRARAALEYIPSVGSKELPDGGDLLVANRELKSVAGALFAAICSQQSESAGEAKEALASTAVRQERRERAFYKMTGFPVDADDLGLVLREQSSPATA